MLDELIRPTRTRPDLALLAIRLAVGLGLVAHGLQKMLGVDAAGASRMVGFTEMVGGFGFPGPAPAWAWGAAIIEVVAGVLLIVGLFTRLAALFAAVVLFVAVWQVKWARGWIGGFELDLLYLVVLLALFLAGPGTAALDSRLLRRGRR
jgi:putative oxidoreductase